MSKQALSSKKIDELSKSQAKRKAEELRDEIRHHDYLYYVKNRPKISDESYDRLFDSLVRLEESFPDLATPDSPTRRVGATPRDEFRNVEHEASMLSLEATREEKEVRRFAERVTKAIGDDTRFIVEEKLDGASIELVYEEGVLDRAVTRGDGQRGEEVTDNVKTFGAAEAPRSGACRALSAGDTGGSDDALTCK